MEKFNLITVELLKANGFEDITDSDEARFWKKDMGVSDFSEWELCKNGYYLSMRHNICNSDNEWTLQVDNTTRDSVGCFDITYTWQFDMLMEVLLLKFRLKV